MCGEQVLLYPANPSFTGSPPRVRGTVHGGPRGREGWRITPACAGNSWHRHSHRIERSDHPRVCGEQSAAPSMMARPLGSPPRVRGTGDFSIDVKQSIWITPACAGNSRVIGSAAYPGSDHPRVCGEQLYLVIVKRNEEGSPPRVRGTVADGNILQ